MPTLLCTIFPTFGEGTLRSNRDYNVHTYFSA
nr:MAG TPA: hypothetical protein [Caudoviricetes sp.]